MLDSPIVAYVQLAVLLMELENVLSQFVCVARLPQFYQNGPYQKPWL